MITTLRKSEFYAIINVRKIELKGMVGYENE
ncbi:hypothetical protein JOD14_001346 [Enterococcus lemanii]|nr:hypothetical protein [Enterococcus lemanii]